MKTLWHSLTHSSFSSPPFPPIHSLSATLHSFFPFVLLNNTTVKRTGALFSAIMSTGQICPCLTEADPEASTAAPGSPGHIVIAEGGVIRDPMSAGTVSDDGPAENTVRRDTGKIWPNPPLQRYPKKAPRSRLFESHAGGPGKVETEPV